jgi:hypothetical protein
MGRDDPASRNGARLSAFKLLPLKLRIPTYRSDASEGEDRNAA